jgi:succinate dehydrogenase/fumarate reductase flavoprotein subunit
MERKPLDIESDVLIAGSGAGGLAAAVTAAEAGLKVLVVEKEPVFGGTSCFSAGMVWIPDSRQARAAGIQDDKAQALAYLQGEGGDRLDPAKAAVYVQRAAEVFAWFEDHTHVSYHLSPLWPDYHQGTAGASTGRSLGANPFDARRLGARMKDLRPPLVTTTLFGGMMVGREDLVHFYGIMKSWRSAAVVGRRWLRYLADRLGGHPRSTRLSNGNALVAMLAQSCFERGVELRLNTALESLTVEGGRVTGAVLKGPEGTMRVRLRGGVVLACGGFPGSDTMRARFFPHVARGLNHHSAAPATNTGDGLAIGQQAGAVLVERQHQPAAWTPMSLVPQPDGRSAPFPHYNDRGKAGYIAVDRRGRRFISEARSYHDFVPAMIDACRGDAEVCSWVICDSRAMREYGLGRAPPRPGRLRPFIASGYLKTAGTLDGLAQACGIDPAGLAQTVQRFNAGAARGEDAEFGKGADVYERFNGSRGHGPNPCVAPITTGPFYAVKVVPGDIGTFIGLKTDADARALDAEGRPIAGLYAAGNDAASFMGGTYPGAGITLGPAMVFGHIAARHIAARLQTG